MTILDEIVEAKKEMLKHYPRKIDVAAGRQPLKFKERVKNNKTLSIISEVKRASPSQGSINGDMTPATQAGLYVEGGTTAVSVLTEEEYFKGSLNDLAYVRNKVDVPILDKDFIIDERQIVEAYNHGADIILLIVSILSDAELEHLYDFAASLGLECIVEVHDEEEMKRALKQKPEIIGINNRDLKTFKVDLATTETLLDRYYDEDILFIGESGVKSEADAVRMKEANALCLLVGETLMRTDHPGEVIRELKVKL